MHDCWPFEGTEHYSFLAEKPKYYKKIQAFLKDKKKNLIRDKNIKLVAPSNWMKEKAIKSFEDFTPNVVMIPNAIPNIFFEKYSKLKARKNLDLPKDKILILFSSFGGEGDLRKGINLIIQLLNSKHNKDSNYEFITIGSFKNMHKFNKEKLTNLGKIDGNNKLREIYKAVDIVLVPSLIDNLPQVATEAQACGRPVIGFNIGGMSDIVINNETGFLSNKKDLESLQNNINKAIKNQLFDNKRCNQITNRAYKLWSNKVINNSYINLYNEMLNQN
jgi:glycosyltransferase involved in cell wall biosynthesis